MINYRARGVTVLHSIFTTGAAILFFWLWAAIYFVGLRCQPLGNYARYLECSSLLVVAFIANHLVSAAHRLDLLQMDFLGALRLSIRQSITVLCVILIYLYALRDSSISRIFLFSLIPIFCAGLVFVNASLPRLLASTMFTTGRRQRTILLGSPEQARLFTKWLRNKSRYGVDVVGIVTNASHSTTPLPWPVLGCPTDLEQIITKAAATQIIVLYLPDSLPRAARLGRLCENLGTRLIFVNDIEQRFSRSVQFFEDAGVRLVSLREEPLECPFNRILKRILNVAISLPVVIFILPAVSLFVLLAHRLQSPGPLFFRQRRTGFQMAPFEIIKYRTMHINNPDEAAQATRGDARIFEIGRWLRRLSIDELPQFINVLHGDMSVVGPRPHMIEHDCAFAKSAEIYRVRSFVRPGITGLAQVNGFRGEARNEKDVIDRVRSNVYYLEHWTFGLDWAIIAQTAWQFVRPSRSAY